MSDPVLRLDHVDKFFGPVGKGVHAVKDISMEVARGDIVALLGSSGCGKTSTLRMIAGFEAASRGRILIGGREVQTLPPVKRNVAMAFEGYSLYPPLTVRENIAFALKSSSHGTAAVADRVDEVATMLEIGDILDRYPASISGGQQQRASLARALIRDADLHLLDEPMGQLEPQLRTLLRGRIKHFIKERGLTAILVTHDQTEANALADRIAVMEAGRLVQIGPPLEVYRRPRTTFVADFLGSPPMNLLDVTYEGGAFHRDSFTLDAAPWRDALQGRDGQALTLGVRPEHLQLADADAPLAIPGEMYGLEPLGPEALVSMDVNGTLVVVRVFTDDPPDVSGRLHAAFAPEHLHLFASPSGERIA